MIAHGILDHLWQSTLFAGVAWLMACALRNNSARLRYWVWFGASLKFLVPFHLLMLLGSQLQWRVAATGVPGLATPADIIMQFGVELTAPTLAFRASTLPSSYISAIVVSVWALGFAAVLARWLASWVRLRAIVHGAVPAAIPAPIPARFTRAPLEPGVLGVVRPILVLPAGITERLTPAQLQTVVAHEICHVRRGDNLTAAIHMMIQAALWFHPLIWWIGARLVEERERACDEAVLQLGNDGQTYAESILKVCKLYMESKLGCVAGVTGPSLKQRIEVIMSNRAIERLSATKKLSLATATAAVIVAPICMGLAIPPAAMAHTATDAQTQTPADAPARAYFLPNFKDADITMVAEAVGAAIGRSFIIDPRVRAHVTMISAKPMSPATFYVAFLSVLDVYGFSAEPDGDVIKVVPVANARQRPPVDVGLTSDELVTQVVEVKNVLAAQLVPLLRPLLPKYGHLTAYPASNVLVISDRVSNVHRVIRIIRAIDQPGINLDTLSAEALVR